MNKKLGPKIIELRSKGLTYNQIVEELNCSKSTVCYHCGENQKESFKKRLTKNRKKNILLHKVFTFNVRNYTIKEIKNSSKKIEGILSYKMSSFSKRNSENCVNSFKVKELKEKIGNDPRCYLTGRKIDLTKSRSYQLDHIIPVSKGGDNSLENCGICCSEANRAKSDLLLDDFIKLCKEIISQQESINNP